MKKPNINQILGGENCMIIAIKLDHTIYTEFGLTQTNLYNYIDNNDQKEKTNELCLVLKGAYNNFHIIPVKYLENGRVESNNKTIEFGGHRIQFFTMAPAFVV